MLHAESQWLLLTRSHRTNQDVRRLPHVAVSYRRGFINLPEQLDEVV